MLQELKINLLTLHLFFFIDDNLSMFALHKWYEEETLCGYVTQQSYSTGNLSNIGAHFASPVLLKTNNSQKLIVKNDGIVVKEIDVISQVQNVLNGTLMGTNASNGYNIVVSWEEDGYFVNVEFYSGTNDIYIAGNVATITIYTIIDLQVSEYEFSCDVI